MINTLLAIKKQMTSTYDSRGRRVGATVIEVVPNFITQVKSVEKDGYSAIQLGIGSKKSVKKPQLGHFKKIGIEASLRWVKEIRSEDKDIQPGQEITLSQVFSKGDAIKVTGVSKGKGFQGGVRRHGFAGGPKTHGQSDRHRAPGSIGQTTTPGRVYKGKKMAGHMGDSNVSVRGLEIVGVDKMNNLLTVKGAVPGVVGGLVTVTKLGRIKGYTPPPEEKADEDEGEEVLSEAKDHTQGEKVSEEAKDIKADEQKAAEQKEGDQKNA